MIPTLVAVLLTLAGATGGWVAHPAPPMPRMKITMNAWR